MWPFAFNHCTILFILSRISFPKSDESPYAVIAAFLSVDRAVGMSHFFKWPTHSDICDMVTRYLVGIWFGKRIRMPEPISIIFWYLSGMSEW